MTHDEKLKLIDDLYAATGAGDWERAESMLTEDFFASEADHLPMKGRFTGRGGLRELYTLVFTMVDASGIKPYYYNPAAFDAAVAAKKAGNA